MDDLEEECCCWEVGVRGALLSESRRVKREEGEVTHNREQERSLVVSFSNSFLDVAFKNRSTFSHYPYSFSPIPVSSNKGKYPHLLD